MEVAARRSRLSAGDVEPDRRGYHRLRPPGHRARTFGGSEVLAGSSLDRASSGDGELPMRFLPNTRAGRTRLAAVVLLPAVATASVLQFGSSMPGRTFTGPPPALSADAVESAERMRAIVERLSTRIGERHGARPAALDEAAGFIEESLTALGHEVVRQPFDSGSFEAVNLEAVTTGSSPGSACIVLGAHYDTAVGTPGADDNASGVAALLELARRLPTRPPRLDVRFVFFANEEPPHFRTDSMGSLVYARRLADRGVPVVAMFSLESIGYFTSAPGSQRYPFPVGLLYPDRGDFVGFVGDLGSRSLVRRAIGAFREHASIPSEGLAAPSLLPGVGWSDHWSFWQQGVPAVMVTCTAPFRNPAYHRPTDVVARLDFDAMARVVDGLLFVVERLDRGEP
jgi:hypothetical protein